jgi:hypothetical protein
MTLFTENADVHFGAFGVRSYPDYFAEACGGARLYATHFLPGFLHSLFWASSVISKPKRSERMQPLVFLELSVRSQQLSMLSKPFVELRLTHALSMCRYESLSDSANCGDLKSMKLTDFRSFRTSDMPTKVQKSS